MNGDLTCGDCGAPMKEYDLPDRNGNPTGETEIVCPNQYKQTHPQ